KQDYKEKVNNTILFFVVPGFVNRELKGYMVKNKAMGFVVKNDARELSHEIGTEYLDGFANIDASDEVRRNRESWNLDNEEWFRINKNPRVFSIIDDYEEVVTNNGLIAYYFFEQAEDGTIILKNNSFLSSVMRPIKK